MSCPNETRLWLHRDDPEASPDVAVHLQLCEGCRDRLDALASIDAVIAEEEPLPEGLYERMLAIPERRTRRPLWLGAGAVAAAAAILVVLLVTRERPGPVVIRTPDAPIATAPDVVPVPGWANVDLPRSERIALALRASEAGARAFLDDVGEGALGTLHRLVREGDPEIVGLAIEQVGRLGRRESIPVLRGALQNDATCDVAAIALGRIGDPRAIPLLETRVPDIDATVAIAAIGGKPAVHALGRSLDGASVTDGALLLSSIGRIDGDAALDVLLRYTDDPLHGRAARLALVDNQSRLMPHLLARATATRSDRALPALTALERLAPASAVPALRPLLDRRGRSARVARVLARIDTPDAHDALLAGLRQPGVRDAFRSAGPGMEARLLDDLGRGPKRDRLQRIDLLGLCGREGSVERLASLATDPVFAPQVVVALGRIGGASAAEALSRLAAQPALRRPAVDALGWTGAQEAVPVLAQLAAEERGLLDPVLQALARHASPEAVTAIARLDPRGTRAGRTLRAMDREVVIPALIAMLDAPDPSEAPAARRALRAIGHPVPASAGGRTRLQ